MRDEARLPVHVRLAIANWPEDAPWGAVTVFCSHHRIARSWFYELLARARDEGALAVVAPRSTAPARQAARVPADVEAAAIAIREELIAGGFDGGPISVRHAMAERGLPAPSRSTLARIFTRRGVAVSSPQKRPRTDRRFTYPAPNECWQLDGFDHPLADGTIACVLQVIDDHSRRVLASRAAPGERSVDVQAVLAAAIARVGVPQRFLSDNGAALNPTRLGRRGIVETWLRGQGVQPISSTPGHPQTQGKSERHHQTSQRWLAARPAAHTLADLQGLLDQLEDAYNNRPHQSLGMLTPLQAWAATPVTPPPAPTAIPEHSGDGPDRDTIDRRTVHANGVVHVRDIRIQLGIEHAGSTVLTTYANHDIHVWDRDGLHLRTITVTPDRNYYGNGRRSGHPRPPELSGK
jgi:putative transposase